MITRADCLADLGTWLLSQEAVIVDTICDRTSETDASRWHLFVRYRSGFDAVIQIVYFKRGSVAMFLSKTKDGKRFYGIEHVLIWDGSGWSVRAVGSAAAGDVLAVMDLIGTTAAQFGHWEVDLVSCHVSASFDGLPSFGNDFLQRIKCVTMTRPTRVSALTASSPFYALSSA